ncbi:MAG: polysaccharide deacetylase family protein [Candidatus Margulisbacteria bacterium]|jgi:peptidoglycan/xylan/chitin deacetylase (PgdA/CDA1 family)|nr:polysaccharide deacetylase family protein [Candidatus Margulisiibacteriota bacterium]
MAIFWLCLTLLGAYCVAVPFWLANLALIGLLGLLWDYTRWQTWSWTRRLTGYELPFCLLLLGAWWAVGDAYLPAQALGDALSLTLLIGLFYFLAAAVRSPRDFQLLLKVAFAGYALVLLGGLCQYGMANWGWPVVPGLSFLLEGRALNRISSVFIQRAGTNVFAAFLSLSAPAYIAWLAQTLLTGVRAGRRWRPLGWYALHALVLALTVFNVLFSYSRALLVSLVLVFIFAALRSRYWKQFLAGGAVVLALAIFSLPPLQRTIQMLFDKNDFSNRDHYMSVLVSLEQIARHPLNGWGGGHINARLKQENGRWVDLRGKYKTPEELRRDNENLMVIRAESLADGVYCVFSPHNMYLGYFLEYGFLGFLGVLLLVYLTYRRLSRLPGSLAYSLALGLGSFAVYGLFQDSIRAPVMAYLFWFYLILVLKLEETLRGFNALQYRKVLALAYHRILPEARNALAVSVPQFAAQLNYLRWRKYIFLNAGDFYRRFVAGDEPLNRKICLLTFDDGYRDNLKYALPVLQKCRIPATVFVTVNKIGAQEPYYWDFKNSTEFTRDDLPLNWEELKQLQKAGWTVGSHTLNHYALKQLTAAEIKQELELSRQILAKKLGQVNTVCYPRGAADARVLTAARAAGYGLGFVTNSHSDDLLAFPRVGIYAHDNFWRFLLKLFLFTNPLSQAIHPSVTQSVTAPLDKGSQQIPVTSP